MDRSRNASCTTIVTENPHMHSTKHKVWRRENSLAYSPPPRARAHLPPALQQNSRIAIYKDRPQQPLRSRLETPPTPPHLLDDSSKYPLTCTGSPVTTGRGKKQYAVPLGKGSRGLDPPPSPAGSREGGGRSVVESRAATPAQGTNFINFAFSLSAIAVARGPPSWLHTCHFSRSSDSEVGEEGRGRGREGGDSSPVVERRARVLADRGLTVRVRLQLDW